MNTPDFLREPGQAAGHLCPACSWSGSREDRTTDGERGVELAERREKGDRRICERCGMAYFYFPVYDHDAPVYENLCVGCLTPAMMREA